MIRSNNPAPGAGAAQEEPSAARTMAEVVESVLAKAERLAAAEGLTLVRLQTTTPASSTFR